MRPCAGDVVAEPPTLLALVRLTRAEPVFAATVRTALLTAAAGLEHR